MKAKAASYVAEPIVNVVITEKYCKILTLLQFRYAYIILKYFFKSIIDWKKFENLY